MALPHKKVEQLKRTLDEFDAALEEYPTLGKRVYPKSWRSQFRRELLALDHEKDIRYPTPYASPSLERWCPGVQARIESGATVLFAKLRSTQRSELVDRLRGRDSCTAEHELLLVDGCTRVLGEDAIAPSDAGPADAKPEFVIDVNGTLIPIEAKTLFDSRNVQQIRESTLAVGRSCWTTGDTSEKDIKRLETAVITKLKKGQASRGILVIVQESAWPYCGGAETIEVLALDPSVAGIEERSWPLAIAYVTHSRQMTGIWFNAPVEAILNLTESTRELVRKAVTESFYARDDGIVWTEHNRASCQ